ncbi:palmitoyltransferase [Thraustotheca clavata]|uniref:Palmitoyltransferase n=1 Tax=Thraustotheca clavata TaxID=74557 RepID=A0A1V9ZVU9_9STRA|nr:palmitoyltransferase [Thraustotheca clavata]
MFLDLIKKVENEQDLERIHQALMEKNELVHTMDEQEHSCLHWAAQIGPPALVQLLLDHNADMNRMDQRGLVPLHWAAAANNLKTIQVLVNHPECVIDALDRKHQTPLLLAARNGHVLTVLYMLKRGADATIVDANQDNFIHWAAYKGSSEVLTLFHAYAGQFAFDTRLFHAVDAFGQTPLHLASSQGHLDCVEYLVEELDTSITIVDAKGNTPWTLAQSKGHAAVFAYLTNKFQPAWNRQLGHALYFWCVHAMNAEAVSLRPFLGPKAPFYFLLGNFLLVAYWNLIVFLNTTQLFLSAFTWACFGCAWHTEAGFVNHDPVMVASYTTVMDAIVNNDKVNLPIVRLCHTCRVEKPNGAKHCRHCRKCVLHFDHQYISLLNIFITFVAAPISTIAWVNTTTHIFFCVQASWQPQLRTWRTSGLMKTQVLDLYVE